MQIDMQDATEESAADGPRFDGEGRPVRIVGSEELLQGAREILIRHGAEHYRLRLTRVGKLILNK